MALTYTPETPLGSPVPEFSLKSVQGELFNSKDISDAPAQVYAFICGHCPYVQAIEDRLVQLGKDLKAINVPFIAICSNDPTDYPEDTAEALKLRAQKKGYGFPYLIDEEQNVAKAFGAVCTPDFFVYDGNSRLAYRGRLDDSWKNPANVSKRELLDAVKILIQKKNIDFEVTPAMGCSIKWK